MDIKKTYFAYLRKSTDDDNNQVLSLSVQKHTILDFCQKQNLRTKKFWEEKRSAKQKGRPIFNQMLDEVENGNVTGIVCHKPDRLTRNWYDTARIFELMEKGKEFVFVTGSFDNNAQGKAMFGMNALMAKWYVDNLSEETKKGQAELIRQGIFPGPPPIGYLSRKAFEKRFGKETDRIEIDSEVAPAILNTYKMYASGRYSLQDITDWAHDQGIKSQLGNKIGKAQWHNILTNPFYYGSFEWNSQIYPGNHQPIVEKVIWDIVQERIHAKGHSSPQKHYFPFRGEMVCGECGCRITGETQKGHIYYRCTKRRGNCNQLYVRSEEIEQQLAAKIRKITISKDLGELIKSLLKGGLEQEQEFRDSNIANLNRQLGQIQQRLDNLLNLRIDDEITPELYQEKFTDLEKEKAVVIAKLNRHQNANTRWFEQANNFLNIASEADKLFLGAKPKTKAEILSFVCSNLILKDRKVDCDYKIPFTYLVNLDQASHLAPRVGFEPTTCRLTVGRSTIELPGNVLRT